MKKLIAMMMLLLPMLAMGQTNAPIHEYADAVFFCKGENVLEGDAKSDIIVEYVAIYDSAKKAVVKVKGQSKEVKRDIKSSFGSENMQMHILGGEGGCIAISYETLSLAYSNYDEAEYIAFDLDMEKIDKWMRQTGKIK